MEGCEIKYPGDIMHKSVLLQETIELVNPQKGDVFVDATLGAGGHAKAVLEKIGTRGVLIGIDKDVRALELAKAKIKAKNLITIQGSFADIQHLVNKAGYQKVDGIIADLGVSSMQFDEGARGFSFKAHAKLDMRMDQTQPQTAEEVVNSYAEDELTQIFREYGEEEHAKRIARAIVKEREQSPIIWTDQLAEVVRGVKPKTKTKIDPATKVFQALRIEVNGELSALTSALPQMVSLLGKGGRMALISFHSLEDRIVKQFIEQEVKACKCPPEFPKCVCGNTPELKKVTKKPVIPTEKEISSNPRSRSAKLRVAEKV